MASTSSAFAIGGEQWYYMNGRNRVGPIDGAKLASMVSSGELDPETRVWKRGMDQWTPASSSELNKYFSNPAPQLNTVEQLDSTDSNQPAPKRKSRWWIWVLILLAVIAAVAVAYFFWLKPAKSTSNEADQSNAAAPAPIYQLKDYVVFENDQCAFIIDDIGEKGDYLELDVRCINKTSDVLEFTWNSTSVSGSMIDPLWKVYAQGNATLKSSITFPLTAMDSYGLMPADEIKFILSVYNHSEFNALRKESSDHITYFENAWHVSTSQLPSKYNQRIKGYEDYVFCNKVKVEQDGRAYYVREDKTKVYFDEIYDFNGEQLYKDSSDDTYNVIFYEDSFGRPYYFDTQTGQVIYYEGYGFAFYDSETDKYFFYDQYGRYANYKHGGVPEYYTGTPTQEMLNAEMPDALKLATGSHVLHQEYTIYPTGKSADEIIYPARATTSSEQVYWEGEKGEFVVLGGEMDDINGYRVYLYFENRSNCYAYFSLQDIVVNAVDMFNDVHIVMRPNSSCYEEVLVPTKFLKDNKIKSVEEIRCRMFAVGENLSVPLYPICWDTETIAMIRTSK